jgi:hypothetical protein
MDATFGTNDVKYHLFTLMAFDFHHTGVLVAWVITSTNMWRLGGMVECPTSKAFLAYARLETNMFHCEWCPTRTLNIVVGWTLIFYLCCIVLCFGTTLAWGFHNIFIVHGKHIDVGYTMARLCGVEILSQIFFAHGMCWKHGAYAPWRKSRI